MLAKELIDNPSAHATVVVLTGDLGAGKTTLVQGLLKGMGVRRHAPSPTFIIMRHYKIPRARIHPHSPKRRRATPSSQSQIAHVHHMDAYRLKGIAQLEPLDFNALLKDPKNLVVIEWGERIKKAIPKDATIIIFQHGKRENERTIVFKTPQKSS